MVVGGVESLRMVVSAGVLIWGPDVLVIGWWSLLSGLERGSGTSTGFAWPGWPDQDCPRIRGHNPKIVLHQREYLW